MMIERKIIVTGCHDCPFKDYVPSTLYENPYYKCTKFNLVLNKDIAYSVDKTHPQCMLPINIESKHVK